MIKQKSWLWYLTLFANPYVHTTLYPHIYVSKNFYTFPKEMQGRILKHEKIHLLQQKEQGLLKFFFLYLFAFPLLYNPWRYKWEREAYTKSGTSQEKTKKYLSSWHYGWLVRKRKRFKQKHSLLKNV